MKHWTLDQVAWDRFDPSRIDPGQVPLVKAAAMVEHNGNDYAAYLCNVFHDDPDAARTLVRFAFCKRDEVLTEAVRRLAGLRVG